MIELKIEYDQYVIVNDDKMPQLKRIKFNGSGSVHAELAGLYTNPQQAMNAIKHFNSEKANADKERPTRRNKPVRPGPDNGSKSTSVPAGRDVGREELHVGEGRDETAEIGDRLRVKPPTPVNDVHPD